MADANHAFTGAWVNWSKGGTLGSTVTISATHGSFLVAFLALFVRWSGAHLWGIICYILHQFRSTPEPRDGLYHQHQAVLRNAVSDSSALWYFSSTAFRWNGNTQGTLRRSLPLIVITISHMAIFAICGIFSSRVTTAGEEMLVNSEHCGFIQGTTFRADNNYTAREWELLDAIYVSAHWSTQKTASYARQCYAQEHTDRTSLCNELAVPRIESNVYTSEPCPFQGREVCNGSAIKIDSGWINSDTHLGINAPPKNRIQMKKVTTCAVIPAEEKYSTLFLTNPDGHVNDPLPENSFKYYNMGADLINKNSYTYYVSNYSMWSVSEPYILSPTFSRFHRFVQLEEDIFSSSAYSQKEYADNPYRGYTAYLNNRSESDFAPIRDFQTDDSDVTLMSLLNYVRYNGRVDDPWFRADQEFANANLGVPSSGTSWLPSHISSVLGCTEQYQFCNAKRSCTQLTGFHGIDPETVNGLELNEAQKDTFKLIMHVAYYMRLQILVFFLRSQALVAQQYLWGHNFVSSALDQNQWHIEVENFHNMSLAALQRGIVDHASPPILQIRPGVESTDYIVKPESDGERNHCGNQKIRSTAYSSFSVLGLSIIMVGGTFIILINLCLSGIVGWFQKRHGSYRFFEWNQGDYLQLQRLAFEGANIGPWKGKDDAVPLTVHAGMRFRIPTTHPTWKAPISQNEPGQQEDEIPLRDIKAQQAFNYAPSTSQTDLKYEAIRTQQREFRYVPNDDISIASGSIGGYTPGSSRNPFSPLTPSPPGYSYAPPQDTAYFGSRGDPMYRPQ
ncbi:hypothetical protein M501DRAFT_197728 [Patellaria atrata CBS 101060]|uniref:Uncharacterized protein n=1 Tax=Patellaria atrata CBS 101060 TaxID=1346257 RepID=A0A9P4S8R9_9PEZI|nr:hypothetical protein M501DRAFT_197728 [Patellaria atrata CBS 101060]